MTTNKYKAIVIGVSAGGGAALARILSYLPKDFKTPIIIVQHLHPNQAGSFAEMLNNNCALSVIEANEKEIIQQGHVYLAPPNYHLLIEPGKTFALSIDEKVNYSRPSVDVLFESAVDVYSPDLIGIVLTGANNDGAYGLSLIKDNGGLAIVQEPATAEFPIMPQAAIDAVKPDYILPLEKMAEILTKIC